jgi:hypothetical protein
MKTASMFIELHIATMRANIASSQICGRAVSTVNWKQTLHTYQQFVLFSLPNELNKWAAAAQESQVKRTTCLRHADC